MAYVVRLWVIAVKKTDYTPWWNTFNVLVLGADNPEGGALFPLDMCGMAGWNGVRMIDSGIV